MSDYDETNKGSLFPLREEYKVFQQGKVNIDGQDHRVIAVKRNNKEGEPMVELYRAIGTLKKNDGKTGNQPDARGMVESISVDSVKSMSAWKKTSKNGMDFVSLAFQEIERQQVAQSQEPRSDMPDDDIPF